MYEEVNPIQEVYMGYYVRNNISTLLAVSKKRSVLKNYLENHRGLNPFEYDIIKQEISDNELMIKYSDYIISNFIGYYIPEIDQVIISIYSEDVDMLINNTIENLKRIYMLSSNVKKILKRDNIILLDAIKKLLEFRSNHIIKKLKKASNKNSPILFCGIKEYLEYIRGYQEQREMNSRYRDLMMSDQ